MPETDVPAASADSRTPPRRTAKRQEDVIGIARLVLLIAGITIFAMSTVVLVGSWSDPAERTRTTQLVFNSLLPLLGTWVGTVLAYYFSRQNFDAASESVERMVSLTTEQKLAQIVVEGEMIRPAQITSFTIPAGKSAQDVLLKDLWARLGGRITRLPIVDDSNVVIYIIHQSGLFKFLADKALAGAASAAIDTLTLQDLVNDAELKSWVSNIVFVSEKASIADAKRAMEQQPGCQDLIVTKSGSKTEPMLGWMTNIEIGRLSKA